MRKYRPHSTYAMGFFCEEYFLNLNMNEIFFLVEEAIEGGYNARAIGESIFTEGDTLDELKINIRDAVHCHFDEDNEL